MPYYDLEPLSTGQEFFFRFGELFRYRPGEWAGEFLATKWDDLEKRTRFASWGWTTMHKDNMQLRIIVKKIKHANRITETTSSTDQDLS